FLQQTGGHRGGWDEYDHQTFLKFRNRHKGKQSFLDVALNSLPGRTMLEVKEHENWYQEYLALLDKKKIGIQKWKIQKKAEKEELISKVGEDDIESSDDEETKQKKAQQMEKEKIEKMEKLNAWKVQKELERMQEEEKKMKEQLRHAQNREKERKRQLELKSRVREYAKQKKEEEENQHIEMQIRREIELEEKRRVAEAEISRFQERDQRRLIEKQAKEKAKEAAWQKKQQQLEKLKGQVKVQVQRDPSRLYKLTEGWKERQKDSESSHSGQMLHIPHRSVPSWRSGL
ncbi:coiled-coil domain-containing protein 112-like, partial [Saccoglossus kowalevskii]